MKRLTLLFTILFLSWNWSISQSTINITTSGGSYSSEKWVNITTELDGGGTQVWGQGDGSYGNGAGLINVDISIAPGTYYVNCYDKYGDGWDGTTISVSAYGSEIGNNGGSSPNDGVNNDSSGSWEPLPDGSPNPDEQEASFEIVVPDPPSCAPPSSIAATNITDTSADLGWTAGGSETTWNLEWGAAGFTQGSGTVESGITVIPYNLTGLMPSTDYEYYVQSDCGQDGTSDWAGPYEFRTTGPGMVCENPISISSLPYNTTDNTSSYGDDYDGSPGSSGCGSSSSYLNGDDVVYEYTPSADGCIDINLTGITDTYTGIFVYESCSDIGSSCSGGDVNSGSTADLEISGVNVTANTPIYIVISTWATPQSTGYTLDIAECPSCQAPIDLTATSITETSADLGWTAAGNETTWNIEWGTAGFAQGSGMTVSGTTNNPYGISGLIAATDYDFYVQADCGQDGMSTWAGPFTFTTKLGCPNPEIIGSLPFNTTDNTSNYGDDYNGSPGSSGCGSSSSYLNGDDVVYEYTPSADGCININLTGISDTYTGLFLYESCSDIGSSCSGGDVNSSSTADLEILGVNVTANTPIYIVISTWASPQSTGYTLDVVDCPSCPTPTSLTATNITESSADLSWTAGGSETSWQIEWGPAGFTQGNGTYENATTNPTFSLSNLTPTTSYDYYVLGICGSGDSSEWAGPFTFSTSATPPPNNDCADAIILNCGDVDVEGTTLGATDNDDETLCDIGGSGSGGVWYKFTGTGEMISVAVYPDPSGNSSTDLGDSRVNVYSGTCSNLSCVGANDDNSSIGGGGSLYEFSSTSGTEYYIYVDGYGSSNVGDFLISLGCCPAPSNVSLASSDMSLVPANSCDEIVNGTTYYGDGTGSYFFAIDWGTTNDAAKDVATVSITVNDQGAAEDTATPEATYTMSRYWNVDLNGESLQSPVTVRFYYDEAEKTAVETAASDFASNNNTSVEAGKWFKTVGTEFDPSVIMASDPGQGAIELSGTEGDENGVHYVEFEVSSFSGGTFAVGAGQADSALPIELLSLKAYERGAQNIIAWTTASEINTDYVAVENSPDGRAWESIDRVKAEGSKERGASYEVADNNPYFLTYYRLRVVDFDGTETYSDVKFVKRTDATRAWKITAIPNPTAHNTVLNFESYRDEQVTIQVVDIQGRVVSKESVSVQAGLNKFEINLEDQNSGTYIIKVNSDSRSEVLRAIKI